MVKDKKISVYSKQTVDDGMGGSETAWARILTNIWAYYRSLSAKEYYNAGIAGTADEVLFIVNYNTAIKDDMVISFGGGYYQITRIDDFEGRKEDLKVYCKERMSNLPV